MADLLLLIDRLQNIIRLLGRLDQRLTEMAPSGKPLTSTVDGQQALSREPSVCLFFMLRFWNHEPSGASETGNLKRQKSEAQN